MSIVLNIKSNYGNKKIVKSLIKKSIEAENKKLDYIIQISKSKIMEFENKYRISTEEFIEKFKKTEIEETEETFDWWAEYKVIKQLEENKKILSNIQT